MKLVLEPGFDGRPLPRLREDVFRAAMAEAKARKMRTTVHVGTDADARLAIEAGANGIEHTARGLSDETIALMAAKKITFTPTNVVLDCAWKRERRAAATILTSAGSRCRRSCRRCSIRSRRWRRCSARARWPTTMAQAFAGSLEQTSRAIRAGVPILAGSDAGNPVTFHGVSLIRELELLAQAGMPLGDVLKSATSRAADRLGQSTLGRITAGAVADLVRARRRSDRARRRLPRRRGGVSRRPEARSGRLTASRPGRGVPVYAEAEHERPAAKTVRASSAGSPTPG